MCCCGRIGMEGLWGWSLPRPCGASSKWRDIILYHLWQMFYCSLLSFSFSGQNLRLFSIGIFPLLCIKCVIAVFLVGFCLIFRKLTNLGSEEISYEYFVKPFCNEEIRIKIHRNHVDRWYVGLITYWENKWKKKLWKYWSILTKFSQNLGFFGTIYWDICSGPWITEMENSRFMGFCLG